jgi:hypothetical protein
MVGDRQNLINTFFRFPARRRAVPGSSGRALVSISGCCDGWVPIVRLIGDQLYV